MAVLPDGRVLYFDGLEGMNHVKSSTALEFGHVAQNDQSRVLDLSGPAATWTTPSPEDGGVNPNGAEHPRYLAGGAVPHNNDNTKNDGDLFCSSLVQLTDAFGHTLSILRSLVAQIRSGGEQIGASAGELLATAEEHAACVLVRLSGHVGNRQLLDAPRDVDVDSRAPEHPPALRGRLCQHRIRRLVGVDLLWAKRGVCKREH